MLLQLIQDMATQGFTPHDLPHLLPHWHSLTAVTAGHGSHGIGHSASFDLGTIQAQLQGQQFETDVFKSARNSVNSFLKTGKHWVFLAGLVAGYLLRAGTSYGS
ncbi:MAG: hypothetical protein KME07_13680 [Pegethrix bostrychoides GSE-TBD4-15B]|jgi:hypothetical protein|uniref:Uncharacterized protein n=1 Tax=Pegethrix bostrychoides GSE-TBD4-15B TaxID=2839662 RepID=A0A951U5B7_9CYAN|nr:hypothetical protein [Pegethrix bostrychoides GSE-TBD4-15B]